MPQREHRRLHDEVNEVPTSVPEDSEETGECCSADLAEVYLFYGSSPQRVMYLAHHGFPLDGPRPDEVLSPVRDRTGGSRSTGSSLEADAVPDAAFKLFGEGAWVHQHFWHGCLVWLCTVRSAPGPPIMVSHRPVVSVGMKGGGAHRGARTSCATWSL